MLLVLVNLHPYDLSLCWSWHNEYVNIFENRLFIEFIDDVIEIWKYFEFKIFIVIWTFINIWFYFVYNVEIDYKTNILLKQDH